MTRRYRISGLGPVVARKSEEKPEVAVPAVAAE
jgi:hypothetical protein